jgi:uncharacterized membrane protein YfcA
LNDSFLTTFLPLSIFVFSAGFIDSIAGGGGLIQLPALLVFLPSQPIVNVLGTNKLISATGTSMATAQYARAVPIDWKQMTLTAGSAFVFSLLGARVVSLMNPSGLRPIVIVLLVIITLYTFLKKDFGEIQASRFSSTQQRWISVAAGASIGFYDGFFGPGTGSFLIFVFIALCGLNFLQASASSKVVNLSTNIAAVLYFGLSGHILFSMALPLAAFNILGAIIGSRLAILKGSKFVRILFLVVAVVIITKLMYDTFLTH